MGLQWETTSKWSPSLKVQPANRPVQLRFFSCFLVGKLQLNTFSKGSVWTAQQLRYDGLFKVDLVKSRRFLVGLVS